MLKLYTPTIKTTHSKTQDLTLLLKLIIRVLRKRTLEALELTHSILILISLLLDLNQIRLEESKKNS